MASKSHLFLLIGTLLLNPTGYANERSPAGLWKAHDDAGNPTGFIRIIEESGVLLGKIEAGLSDETEEQFCTACKDERKNKKLIGMTMMKGVKPKADYFEGEEILDPFSGNTYRVKLKLIEKGKKLEVRGFVGFSLFGRTQIWERVE
jgi:uncharacterized protein (DUF2147 family)